MRFLKKRNFVRFTDIKEEVASYLPNADFSLLEKAYVFSAKVHKGQTRLSGEPYLIHPLEVAMILAKLRMDLPTVSAGLLHDVLEDTLTSFGELKELFGEEIANLVDGVTKISKLPLTDPKVSQAETYRKMIMAMAKDIRVILIKLADRLHNVRTLEYHEEEKRKLIAKETIEIYAPIAHRLGIEWMKNELENLAFQYLDPVVYNEIYRKLRRFEKEKQKYIEEVKEILKKILKENGIEAEIQGRIKEPYSVYEKMKRLGIDFEQVYDLLAFRVIVNTEQECYQALGIIHSLWTPVPGRFKDYIALPKPNFYQSLHTTVIGPYGERMEVQIRTWEMHKVAEDGIAAHWKYKTGKGLGEEEVKKIGWLRQILELQRELEDPKEFLHILKIDLYPDEVYVFTPKGEVKVLPKGATPIDFAYSIHTDIGNHCYGARVNGKLVPLDYELKSGEIVEILTSPKAHPNRDWLKFAKTSRARTKILKFLREQEKKHAIILGQELCEKELKKVGLSLSEFQKKEEFKNLLESFNFKSSDDLFAAIGFGKITVSQVVDKIAPQETPVKKSESKRIKLDNLIKINGMENLLVYFAKCCNPLPGDEVVGFITRGHGISIHTSDCPNVLSIPPERYVEVEWKGENGFLFPVKIKVQAEDRKGLLAALSNSISQMGINILKAYVNTTKTGEALNFFEVEISNTKQLEKLLSHLRKVKGVKRVERVKKWV
jgi:GTP pyrophosphokinase